MTGRVSSERVSPIPENGQRAKQFLPPLDCPPHPFPPKVSLGCIQKVIVNGHENENVPRSSLASMPEVILLISGVTRSVYTQPHFNLIYYLSGYGNSATIMFE
jgi:hypothetical protein